MIFDAQAEIRVVGVREVRVIPPGWTHPKDERGRPRPLLPAERYYLANDAERAAHFVEFGVEEDPANYMPRVDGLTTPRTAIALYETTSEGTPLSPAFPNTPEARRELVAWCADSATTFGDNRTSVEGWAALLFGDAVVGNDGTVSAGG